MTTDRASFRFGVRQGPLRARRFSRARRSGAAAVLRRPEGFRVPRRVFQRSAIWAALASLGLLACDSSRAPAAPEDLGSIGSFSLTDQQGQSFTPERLSGRPWVAAFTFTRCPTVCPRIVALMKRADALARTQGLWLGLVTISVDPEHDTPPVLSAYAREHELSDRWRLLTGDSSAIARTAEERFHIGVAGSPDPQAEHFGMTHGSHLVLIDGAGHIRGYFPSADEQTPEALVAAAQALTDPAAPR